FQSRPIFLLRACDHRASGSRKPQNAALCWPYFSSDGAPRATSPSIGTPRLTTLLTLREQVENAVPKFNGPADMAPTAARRQCQIAGISAGSGARCVSWPSDDGLLEPPQM